MSAFIEWLESLNKRDTKVRAVLRRSLAFEPGAFPAAFPYVEPFISSDGHAREMHYLTAGLWAAHWRDGRSAEGVTIGEAAAHYQALNGSGALERRFITLLDADSDQLPHRLRQMVALLKEYPLDFSTLLDDLLRWTHPDKRTQNRWARDFYRSLEPIHSLNHSTPTEEPLP
jgi:CRISPR system Cascade subunit CasB